MRRPTDSVSRGLRRTVSWAYQAPKTERQFISVGEGSKRKLEMLPCKKICTLVNVAWPNWLSAMVSFD